MRLIFLPPQSPAGIPILFAAQENDFIGHDFSSVDLTIFVVIASGLESSFDVHLFPLGEISAYVLLPPENYVCSGSAGNGESVPPLR